MQNSQHIFTEVASSRNYNEAYIVDKASFEEVIQALFWITRYDATIPELILICPKNADYSFNFCKYGNIHFYIRKEKESKVARELQQYGLEEWIGPEFDRFSDFNAIRGRFTIPEE